MRDERYDTKERVEERVFLSGSVHVVIASASLRTETLFFDRSIKNEEENVVVVVLKT